MTLTELLRKAKGLIEERGWCRGRYYTSDGRICASTAITEADQFLTVPVHVADLLLEAAREDIPKRDHTTGNTRPTVETTNDSYRQKDDVLHWFDRAIALSERNHAG